MRLRKRRDPADDAIAREPVVPKRKRSWRSRLGEFAIWTAVAVGTALIMIRMSETLLPTNF